MDIYEFVGLLTDDGVQIAIYDFTTGEEVFCGEARDATEEFSYSEVLSIDITPPDSRGVTVVLNIETEEEEED